MKLIGYDSDAYNREYGSFNLKPAGKIARKGDVRKTIYDRDKGICQLCLTHVNYKDASLDHILPKFKGGSNAQYNLQIAHTWCNSIKGCSTRVMVPEYYINHALYGIPQKKPTKSKSAILKPDGSKWGIPKAALQDSVPKNPPKPETKEEDPCRELWNEIATNGFTNISYKKFKHYFERYK